MFTATEIEQLKPQFIEEEIKQLQLYNYVAIKGKNDLSLSQTRLLVDKLWGNVPRLRLSCYNLNDNWAIALAGHRGLTELSLYNNQITDEGVIALASLPKLVKLDVSRNQIGAQGARALAQHPVLGQLDISLNRLGDEGAIALASSNALTTLIAQACQITERGTEALAKSKTLTALDIGNNQVGNKGAKALASNTKLRSLMLSGAGLGNEGAAIFADNKTLLSLELGRNQITNNGAVRLAFNNTLTALDIGFNQIGSEGAEALALNKTLRRLNLSFNQVEDKATEAFAANPNLFSLDLWFNRITDVGAAILAHNKNITTLEIRNNPLSEEGKAYVENFLQSNRQQVLKQRNCFMHGMNKTFKRINQASSLPNELIMHIATFLDITFYLSLLNLQQAAQLGKTEEQVTQAITFMLHNFEGLEDELVLKERKPAWNERVSANKHFRWVKPPSDSLSAIQNNPQPIVAKVESEKPTAGIIQPEKTKPQADKNNNANKQTRLYRLQHPTTVAFFKKIQSVQKNLSRQNTRETQSKNNTAAIEHPTYIISQVLEQMPGGKLLVKAVSQSKPLNITPNIKLWLKNKPACLSAVLKSFQAEQDLHEIEKMFEEFSSAQSIFNPQLHYLNTGSIDQDYANAFCTTWKKIVHDSYQKVMANMQTLESREDKIKFLTAARQLNLFRKPRPTLGLSDTSVSELRAVGSVGGQVQVSLRVPRL